MVFIVMAVIIGFGTIFMYGIGPNWYAAMIDVNLPENRGSMLAAAAFMDAIGRGIGAWLGAATIDYFKNNNSAMPITDTIIWFTVIFGVIQALVWIPVLKHSKKDFQDVNEIMEERAQTLKDQVVDSSNPPGTNT